MQDDEGRPTLRDLGLGEPRLIDRRGPRYPWWVGARSLRAAIFCCVVSAAMCAVSFWGALVGPFSWWRLCVGIFAGVLVINYVASIVYFARGGRGT